MIDEWEPHRVDDLEATLVQYQDGATVCTIHPRQLPEEPNTTQWIAAKDGAYCAIKEMR